MFINHSGDKIPQSREMLIHRAESGWPQNSERDQTAAKREMLIKRLHKRKRGLEIAEGFP